MVEVRVQRLTSDPITQQQVVWLQSVRDPVVVPFAVGETEALAIYLGATGQRLQRPLAHDLILAILGHFEARLEEVHILNVEGGVISAEIVLASGRGRVRLGARPCDAIALALRSHAPIYLSEQVLMGAGLVIKQAGPEGASCLERPHPPQMVAGEKREIAAAVEELLKEAGIEAHSEGCAEAEHPRRRLEILQVCLEEAIKREHYEVAGRIWKEMQQIGREADGR